MMDDVKEFEECQVRLQKCEDFLRQFAFKKEAFISTDYYEMQIQVLKDNGAAAMKEQIALYQGLVDRQKATEAALKGKLGTVDGAKITKTAFKSFLDKFTVIQEELKLDKHKKV